MAATFAGSVCSSLLNTSNADSMRSR